jgi:putative addiction module component (TIGR02574 family)
MEESIIDELRKLSVAERIQLVEDLWDSIAADSDLPLTDAQKAELDRRLSMPDGPLYTRGDLKSS